MLGPCETDDRTRETLGSSRVKLVSYRKLRIFATRAASIEEEAKRLAPSIEIRVSANCAFETAWKSRFNFSTLLFRPENTYNRESDLASFVFFFFLKNNSKINKFPVTLGETTVANQSAL